MSPDTSPAPSVVLVKLGGSLITDKRGHETIRVETLKRLAEDLSKAQRQRRGGLIVGHGSGSFGHAAAKRLGFEPGRDASGRGAAIAEIQDAAARLHRHVVQALLAAGAESFSIVAGSAFRAVAGKPELVAEALPGHLLANGLLPVVYGDVVSDGERGATILSTEALFEALVSTLLEQGQRVEGVVWLGETAGVLDAHGQLIEELDADSAADLARRVAGASGADVTGGMRLRLETAAELACNGVASWIADGREDGILPRILAGRRVDHTFIKPRARPS